jgi:hypothetical protein
MRCMSSQESSADRQTADGEALQALIKVDEQRPADYDGTCLRPLGLCELGGCCEACWYRPDHPRFQRGG